MPTKTQRLLDLIAFLAGRRLPVSIDQIMEAVPAYSKRWMERDGRARDSVRRTFERDKDELRSLGVPIRTERLAGQPDTERPQGYRLRRRDFYLPYVRLIGGAAQSAPADGGPRTSTIRGLGEPMEIAEQDVAPALEGLLHLAEVPGFPLASEAESAYRKLTFDLDPGRFRATPVLFLRPPGWKDIEESLRLLSDARLRRKRVQFRYYGIRRNEQNERDVAPYGLLYQKGHWYLIGQDALRAAVRTFRVSRMEDLVTNHAKPKTADYEIPEGFDLAAYGGLNAWELGDPDDRATSVRVRFGHPTSLWAERNGMGTKVERRPDGSVVRDLEVHDTEAFIRWILTFEGRAQILLPAELRRDAKEVARRVAHLHREVVGD